MIEKIITLITENMEIVRYVIIGLATTIVNYLAYLLCFDIIKLKTVASTVIAWIVGVVFAFFTNKIWVFQSYDWTMQVVLKEGIGFVSARALTGVMEILLMKWTVDIRKWEPHIMKLAVGILVTILNYVASKLFIFAA